jgi:predicted ATP-grasp superfamily ATP-dependent carboligase
MNKQKRGAAIVLGSNINAYSIIVELSSIKQKIPIVLLWQTFSYANLCYRLVEKRKLNYSNINLLYETLKHLHRRYGYLVLYPTADFEIEILRTLYDSVKEFCFLPFNPKNVIQSLDKQQQYAYCDKLGIPYPKTAYLYTTSDFKKIKNIQYPFIIKPAQHQDMQTHNVFRNKIIENSKVWESFKQQIIPFFEKKVSFLVSEIIPGKSDNVYAYVGYRTSKGEIVNEWVGQKLSQFPNQFGVFASAVNGAPEEVKRQGRLLLHEMQLVGINEPEFKYDVRDGKYKLMEINLRSMMWHRVGHLSGVDLQYTQWCDAMRMPFVRQSQNIDKKIHFFYLQYELINLFCRKHYWPIFKYNLKQGDKLAFAEWQTVNPLPFLYSLVITFFRIIKRCLR